MSFLRCLMTVLDDLLEFEQPLSEGVRMQTAIEPKKSFWDLFGRERVVERGHYKYHRTKAGLYVVLPYNNSDGSLDLHADSPKGCFSKSVFEISPKLPLGFFLNGYGAVTWDNSSEYSSTGNFKLISEVSHISEIKVMHTLDSQGNIVSLELASHASHSRYPYRYPYRCTQEYPSTFWSLKVHRDRGASGAVHSHEVYEFLPDGKLNTARTLDLKQISIDYEQSFNNIIKLMFAWNDHQDACQKAVLEPNSGKKLEFEKLYLEMCKGILHSLDCLVFK